MEETVQMEEGLDSPDVEISEPLEGAFGKYLREFRLLNSLLLSLFFVVVFSYACGVSSSGKLPPETKARILPIRKQATAPKQQEQKVRLMQRQKVAKPTQTFTFQAQAISDISVPLVDIETRNFDPAWF